jgi:hypothetical protein
MRSRTLLFLLVLCVPTLAFGQIARISPSTLYVGPYEDFLTIYGSNLVGTESTLVEFSGPAGVFTSEPVVAGESGEYLISWIPLNISLVEGEYEIRVYATDVGSAPRVYGPATLSVIELVIVAPPLLFVPEVLVVPATGPTGANVTYPVEAVSQGGTGLTVSCTPPSGSLIPLGQTSVTCTATDSVGSTSQSFTVYVADYTPPVFTSIPEDISTTDPVVTFVLAATDDIDGSNVIIGCDPPSGATFPFGTTNVQCIAYDQSFNPAYASFNVTVAGGPPVLTLPPNIVEEATSAAGAVVNYTVTATNEGVISCSPASGSTFPIANTTVNCTATNAAGSRSVARSAVAHHGRGHVGVRRDGHVRCDRDRPGERQRCGDLHAAFGQHVPDRHRDRELQRERHGRQHRDRLVQRDGPRYDSAGGQQHHGHSGRALAAQPQAGRGDAERGCDRRGRSESGIDDPVRLLEPAHRRHG